MAKKEKEQKEVKEKEAPVKKAPVQKKAPVAPKVPEKENFRGIIRIAGKDIKGEVELQRALSRVRGIGHTMAISAARAIQMELSLDPKMKVGELTDAQIESLDKVLQSLQDYKVMPFLFNRRGDFNSGKDRHVIMNDLIFENTQDIDRDKKMYTWRGYRHTYGAKVRGQRTRNTGRTGMAVGVLRKSIAGAVPAAAAAAKPAAGAAAPAAAKPAEKKPAAAEKK
jgi:small subunit ribosomal protein S13